MKKRHGWVFAILIVVLAAALFVNKILVGEKTIDLLRSPNSTSVAPSREKKTTRVLISKTFIFVPYWTVDGEVFDHNSYDGVVYFGIQSGDTGIDKKDPGYQKIGAFLSQAVNIENKILAVRMLNTDENASVLKDPILQQKIIDQSIETARQNSFNGVLLDFEYSALSFDSVIKRVNSFYSLFSNSAKNNNLSFSTALYGDTFYRIRPYDVKTIGKLSDTVFLMAYDFHKANGDPGPNFPLSGKESYGYDFSSMVSDFTKLVPPEKLIPTFGMYGYDWTVDKKGNSEGPAEILTLNEIQKKYYPDCPFVNCSITRDTASSETRISYTDSNNQNHSLWFEDMVSVDEKKKVLEQNGIGKIAFWAYSYF